MVLKQTSFGELGLGKFVRGLQFQNLRLGTGLPRLGEPMIPRWAHTCRIPNFFSSLAWNIVAQNSSSQWLNRRGSNMYVHEACRWVHVRGLRVSGNRRRATSCRSLLRQKLWRKRSLLCGRNAKMSSPTDVGFGCASLVSSAAASSRFQQFER